MVVTKGGGCVGNKDMSVKDTRLELSRMHRPRGLRYSVMTVAKNTVLNAGNLLTVDFRYSHHTHSKVTM